MRCKLDTPVTTSGIDGKSYAWAGGPLRPRVPVPLMDLQGNLNKVNELEVPTNGTSGVSIRLETTMD